MDLYEETDFARFAECFQAISYELRQKILMLLQEREYSVHELVDRFGVSQPTVSRNLGVLKRAGLVRDRRVGQQIYYALDEKGVQDACAGFFGRFKCCAPLVRRISGTSTLPRWAQASSKGPDTTR